MDKYYALIEGNNFLVEFDGEEKCMGFFTTFYFEGDFIYKKDVLNYIEDALKDRIKKNEAHFLVSSPSFFYIKELSIIEGGQDESKKIKDGFSFFEMSKFMIMKSILICYIKHTLSKFKFIDSLNRPIQLS